MQRSLALLVYSPELSDQARHSDSLFCLSDYPQSPRYGWLDHTDSVALVAYVDHSALV